MVRYHIKAFYYFIFIFFYSLYAAENEVASLLLEHGDLPISLEKISIDNKGKHFFLCAANESSAGAYAVALYKSATNTLMPLAPEKVIYQGEKDCLNPLFNACFSHMTLLERLGAPTRIALVKNDNQYQSRVYVIDSIVTPQTISVLESPDLRDASGNLGGRIISLSHAQNAIIFAAITSQSSSFGEDQSGIAVLEVAEIKTENNKIIPLIRQLDAGAAGYDDQGDQLPRAALITKNSDVLKIGNDLVHIDETVDLWWDSELRVLYGALSVQGASEEMDGVRALFVGSFDDEQSTQLTIRSIISEDIFSPHDTSRIVGVRGPNASITISHVRVLHSSTGLPYLIVVKKGEPGDHVYALPLVNKRTERGTIAPDDMHQHGTIAARDAYPCSVLSDQETPRFLGRKFADPAKTSSDMIADTDLAACVGGMSAIHTKHQIKAIKVVGDAVYISTTGKKNSGIFRSRALFDEHARIRSWTEWHRVAGMVDTVEDFGIDGETGAITAYTKDMFEFYHMMQSGWQQNNSFHQELCRLIATHIPETEGGLRGLFPFSVHTPELHHISLVVATGKNKVVLIKTGSRKTKSDQLYPHRSLKPVYTVFEGGALQNLGPITAAEIVYAPDSHDAWLCVGGMNGVVLLSSLENSDWRAYHDQATSLIGEYRFVRKLVCDKGFLYVLTDDRCDRIDLTQSNFATGTIKKVSLATKEFFSSLYGSTTFFDLVVSEKIGFLATSRGLFRIGNGRSIDGVVDEYTAGWTSIPLGNAQYPVKKISALSVTGKEQDLSRIGGGNLLVLSSSSSQDSSYLNRFSVADTSDATITDMTVQPIPDIFKLVPSDGKKNSYFAHFGGSRNQILSDGAFLINQRQQEESEYIVIDNQVKNHKMPLSFGNKRATFVAPIIRDPASGCTWIGGDFGLTIGG